MIREGVLDAIGKTPLVRLRRYLDEPTVRLFAKLESANPGGSAKDRPAAAMIGDALSEGRIGPDTAVIESSSGNMGIGLAQACRYHQIRFVCVVDPLARPENVAIIRALGGEVITVSAPTPSDYLAARLRRVRDYVLEHPGAYWPNQYANRANPRSHTEGTAQEIDEAVGDSLDRLFIATSSTGTAGGCQDFFAERRPDVQVTAVDAVGSVLFDGHVAPRLIPGLGAGVMPRLAATRVFDKVERVTPIDCVVGCRRLATREAILAGGSAGGVLEAVRRVQGQLSGQTVVAVLHDSGVRYLDTVFSDEWVERELGIDRDELRARCQEGSTTSEALA